MERKLIYKYHSRRLLFLTIVLAIFLISPFLFLTSFSFFDFYFGLPELIPFPMNVLLGIAPLIAGWLTFLWTLSSLLEIFKDPSMVENSRYFFIKIGPYSYSRNPLMLGMGLWLLGFTFIFNSLSLLFFGGIMFSFLMATTRHIEERELAIRFGKSFRRYSRNVPFLLPNYRKLRQALAV